MQHTPEMVPCPGISYYVNLVIKFLQAVHQLPRYLNLDFPILLEALTMDFYMKYKGNAHVKKEMDITPKRHSTLSLMSSNWKQVGTVRIGSRIIDRSRAKANYQAKALTTYDLVLTEKDACRIQMQNFIQEIIFSTQTTNENN
ncbi:hypothetical protein V8G54_036646 [Vigna mungo]|uniref:Uncharacterized protein n=1 Tax=Vigna mungo TaxID=3915 RepID=A0AAQ3MHC7_VIGMU